MTPSIPDGNEGQEQFHELLITKLNEQIRLFNIDYLGMVFPGQGPVGVVQLRALFAERLDVPSVIIRINERLIRNRIRLERDSREYTPFPPGSRVLIFSDAATSGASIFKAALIARRFNALCEAAFVIFDRQQRAEERLIAEGIKLISLFDYGFLCDEELNKGLQELAREENGHASSRLEYESMKLTV